MTNGRTGKRRTELLLTRLLLQESFARAHSSASPQLIMNLTGIANLQAGQQEIQNNPLVVIAIAQEALLRSAHHP